MSGGGLVGRPVRRVEDAALLTGRGTWTDDIAPLAFGPDGKLYVALVNTNPRKATNVDLTVPGQAISGVSGQVLTADAMDAHNTFENKQAVKPAPYSARAAGGKMSVSLPARSVMVVAVEG